MMRAAKQPPSVQSVREVAQDVRSAVWREISARLLRGLRALLEGVLEDEVTAHVGAARYERAGARRRHRNGHYTRDLVTTHGPLPKLRVPRLLESGIDFTIFDKYQRRVGGTDHVRRDRASQRELAGASPSANSTECLT